MENFKKVEDRKDLVRDPYSKAIINTDDAAYKKRVEARNRKWRENKRVRKLENDVFEMKTVLNKILEKMEDNNGKTKIETGTS